MSHSLLSEILRGIQDEPMLARRFLTTNDLKKQYIRLCFAYDGGVSPGFRVDKLYPSPQVTFNENKKMIEVIRSILSEFGIHSTELEYRARDCYRIGILTEDIRTFVKNFGIEGYKGEKLLDILYLRERMEDRIEHGMDRRQAHSWAHETWHSYYVKDEGHGYVPHWFQEIYETAASGLPDEEKLNKAEDILEQALEDAPNLRSTLRY